MKFRAVFVSDFHLGANKAQVNQINKFLKTVDCETLYLVGDILDIWRIKQLLRMGKKSKKHFVCINKILRIASRNTKVVYVLGNHDEFLNVFASNFKSDNLEVCNMTIHETAKGDKILIAHGHQFDLASRFPKALLVLGDCMYDFLLFANRIVNSVRGFLGKPHWSLSQYLKKNVKKAINFLETYEKVAVESARKRECSAVVCGHVHTPARKNIDGIEYLNTGCWTEERNCSYIVEHWNGELEIKEFFFDDDNRNSQCDRSLSLLEA